MPLPKIMRTCARARCSIEHVRNKARVSRVTVSGARQATAETEAEPGNESSTRECSRSEWGRSATTVTNDMQPCARALRKCVRHLSRKGKKARVSIATISGARKPLLRPRQDQGISKAMGRNATVSGAGQPPLRRLLKKHVCACAALKNPKPLARANCR